MNSTEILIKLAKELFSTTFNVENENYSDTNEKEINSTFATIAPGRVNLIGEHVDYTGGYVFPMAIGFSTVCYGRGKIVPISSEDSRTCRIISYNQDRNNFVEFKTNTFEDVETMKAFPLSSPNRWANFVMGVVREYILNDIKPSGSNSTIVFDLAIAGDVPLGSGLSSSASLEVSVARFLECILDDFAFSDLKKKSGSNAELEKMMARDRALRCQRADNVFCGIPCGVMDQYVSSAAKKGHALLIDCTTNDHTKVVMNTKEADEESPVIVVCNSNVKHDNAEGEYPLRVQQCKLALESIQESFPDVSSLRYATINHIDKIKENVDDTIHRRAKHVVLENKRTLEAKDAFQDGDFERMGQLFNESHASMRDDYETSCKEIDVLVSLAQSVPGVYGSRLTGGGFGGCTVTLVKKNAVNNLIQYLKDNYQKMMGLECVCFVTTPEDGARVLHPIKDN